MGVQCQITARGRKKGPTNGPMENKGKPLKKGPNKAHPNAQKKIVSIKAPRKFIGGTLLQKKLYIYGCSSHYNNGHIRWYLMGALLNVGATAEHCRHKQLGGVLCYLCSSFS